MRLCGAVRGGRPGGDVHGGGGPGGGRGRRGGAGGAARGGLQEQDVPPVTPLGASRLPAVRAAAGASRGEQARGWPCRPRGALRDYQRPAGSNPAACITAHVRGLRPPWRAGRLSGSHASPPMAWGRRGARAPRAPLWGPHQGAIVAPSPRTSTPPAWAVTRAWLGLRSLRSGGPPLRGASGGRGRWSPRSRLRRRSHPAGARDPQRLNGRGTLSRPSPRWGCGCPGRTRRTRARSASSSLWRRLRPWRPRGAA
mmetsp:Transcript_13644/g.43026  ORF Transcript_13644/g.43026 Transcript_13644/m.43026 type:complete len:254 (+) Transcript_13644:695-1456(+)